MDIDSYADGLMVGIVDWAYVGAMVVVRRILKAFMVGQGKLCCFFVYLILCDCFCGLSSSFTSWSFVQSSLLMILQ